MTVQTYVRTIKIMYSTMIRRKINDIDESKSTDAD